MEMYHRFVVTWRSDRVIAINHADAALTALECLQIPTTESIFEVQDIETGKIKCISITDYGTERLPQVVECLRADRELKHSLSGQALENE